MRLLDGTFLSVLLLLDILDKRLSSFYALPPMIVSPILPTKNLKNFRPGSLLEGRAEILKIFGWHFGRNDQGPHKSILNLNDL